MEMVMTNDFAEMSSNELIDIEGGLWWEAVPFLLYGAVSMYTAVIKSRVLLRFIQAQLRLSAALRIEI